MEGTASEGLPEAPSPAYVSDFLATSDGLSLTKAFMRIPDPKLRRRIVDLVQQIAGGDVATMAAFAASHNPIPPRAAAEVLAAAKAVFAPLAEQGGRAATASAKTTVSCMVTNAARPLAVPATGGL